MNYEKIKRLVEFDSPTVANGLELLEVQDPTVGVHRTGRARPDAGAGGRGWALP